MELLIPKNRFNKKAFSFEKAFFIDVNFDTILASKHKKCSDLS
jgi:hypothetical protein